MRNELVALDTDTPWGDVLRALHYDDESILNEGAADFGIETFGAETIKGIVVPLHVADIKIDASVNTAVRGALGIGGYAIAKTLGLALFPAAGIGLGVFAVASIIDSWTGW